MTIVHQAVSSSSCPRLLIGAPKIAGLLPAVTTSSHPPDHHAQVQAAAAPLLETAVLFLDGECNDTAVVAAFARFYSQLASLKGAPSIVPPPPAPEPMPRFRTREEMDAEIAEMVAAARERLQRRQQEIQEELRNRRNRSIFS